MDVFHSDSKRNDVLYHPNGCTLEKVTSILKTYIHSTLWF